MVLKKKKRKKTDSPWCIQAKLGWGQLKKKKRIPKKKKKKTNKKLEHTTVKIWDWWSTLAPGGKPFVVVFFSIMYLSQSEGYTLGQRISTWFTDWLTDTHEKGDYKMIQDKMSKTFGGGGGVYWGIKNKGTWERGRKKNKIKGCFWRCVRTVPASAALTLLEPFSCKGTDGMLWKQK